MKTAHEAAGARLVLQTSHYAIASLLTLVAGLVTFPLLTRVFSVQDYGLISLVAATVSVSVAIGKTGIQHALVRYSTEIAAGKSPYTRHQLHSTVLLGMLGGAVLVMAALVLGAYATPERWLEDARVRGLLMLASVLVLVQVTDSAASNLLRAEERSSVLARYQVGKKFLSVFALLFAVLVVVPSLASFYTATVLAEGLAIAGLLWALFRGGDERAPTTKAFSFPLYRELLAIGLPMMLGYELAGVVLGVGDRYVIRLLLGEAPVGLYAAAYNLCQYVQSVFIASIGTAIMPIYMRMYDEEGPAATSAFVERSLRKYVLFAAPVIAGLAAVGPELLPSLASDRYAAAGQILPWIIGGMIVDGAATFVGAGLFIQRRTGELMAVVIGSAVVNIGLNVMLLPRFGITGGAMATLGAYLVTFAAFGFFARPHLPVALPWKTLARAGLAALLMYAVLTRLPAGRRLASVAIRVIVGAPLYLASVAALDVEAREVIRSTAARLRARLYRGGNHGG